MNRWPIIVAASVFMAALAVPIPVQAVDYKMYHGSDCQVFGATAWTDLAFSGYGVKNLASAARNVICPLIKDSNALWDSEAAFPANRALVEVRLETGGATASATCTAYVTTTLNSTEVKSYTGYSGSVTPNTEIVFGGLGYFQSTASSSGTQDKAYLLCTLGPQVRLKGYYLFEEAPT